MLWLTAVLALLLVSSALAAVTGLPLTQTARIPLSGASNRFDYLSVDPASRRLYIAHMDSGELLVFDLARGRVIHTIKAPGVHGVIAVPQLGRVFASATDDHEVLTLDAKTAKVIAHAPAGDYPDGLTYAANVKHVFVSDEAGGVETVINSSGRRIATIALGGGAGNVQYDAGSGHIIIRRISVPCDHPHSLLIDSPHRLGFIACEGDARLLTLDLDNMKITGITLVGATPDVLAFDPKLGRLYVAAESGTVAVFNEGGKRLRKLGQAFLAPAAHTVAVDPTTHRVYFPLERGTTGQPELLVMKPS